MLSLTVTLATFIILIYPSELYQGGTTTGVSNIELESAGKSFGSEKNPVLDRKIRSSLAKKKINNGKHKERKTYVKKPKTIKRKEINVKLRKYLKRNRSKRKRKNKYGKLKKINTKLKKMSHKTSKKIQKKSKGGKNDGNERKIRKNYKNMDLLKHTKKSKRKKYISKSKNRPKKNILKKMIKLTKKFEKVTVRETSNCCKVIHIIGKDNSAHEKYAKFKFYTVSNLLRQIKRIDKKKAQINKKYNKRIEYKQSYNLLLSAIGGDHSNPICTKFVDGLTINSLTEDLDTLLNCENMIEAKCRLPNITYGKHTVCFKNLELIIEARDKCLKDETHNCNATALNDTQSYIQSENCNPTAESKLIVTAAQDCVTEIKSCNKAKDKVLMYIATCPEKGIISKTRTLENGVIVTQDDIFDFITNEYIIHVPTHDSPDGTVDDTTYILNEESGIMMTVKPDTCELRLVPEDFNLEDMKTTAEDDLNNDDDDVEGEIKCTAVFNNGTASPEELDCLSPTMAAMCGCKPIYKTIEKSTGNCSECPKPDDLKIDEKSITGCTNIRVNNCRKY